MEKKEMRARFGQVKLRSVKLVFTTKYYEVPDGLTKADVQKWAGVGPVMVRHFVWPKVVVDGPNGPREFSLTWMNPSCKEKKPGPGGASEIEKVLVAAALGKAQRVPAELRPASTRLAEELRKDIESRVLSACRAVGLTVKVREVWRKARREDAYKALQALMMRRFDELSDYDVREAWKNVKRLRTVRTVLEA